MVPFELMRINDRQEPGGATAHLYLEEWDHREMILAIAHGIPDRFLPRNVRFSRRAFEQSRRITDFGAAGGQIKMGLIIHNMMQGRPSRHGHYAQFVSADETDRYPWPQSGPPLGIHSVSGSMLGSGLYRRRRHSLRDTVCTSGVLRICICNETKLSGEVPARQRPGTPGEREVFADIAAPPETPIKGVAPGFVGGANTVPAGGAATTKIP